MSIAIKQNCIYVLILIVAIVTSIFIYRTTHQDWILFKEAEAQYNRKNFTEAIDLYERSLHAGLPRSQMNVNLINSYVAIGRFNEAIVLYREYLSRHPEDTSARLGLAKVLSWVGDNKGAEEEYNNILEEKHEK